VTIDEHTAESEVAAGVEVAAELLAPANVEAFTGVEVAADHQLIAADEYTVWIVSSEVDDELVALVHHGAIIVAGAAVKDKVSAMNVEREGVDVYYIVVGKGPDALDRRRAGVAVE